MPASLPYTLLPNGRWQLAFTFGIVPFSIALLSVLWVVFSADAAFDWWRTRGYVRTTGVVRSVELHEGRAYRGGISYRAEVRVAHGRGDREYVADRLYFGGAMRRPRALAEAEAARYVVGDRATIWHDPDRPELSILERRFAGGDVLNPWLLPAVAAGWAGVFFHFRPPNRPKAGAGGSLRWHARPVRLARAAVDGGIGLSALAYFVGLMDGGGGWRTAVCGTGALLIFGPMLGYPAVASLLRTTLPGVSATLRPRGGDAWDVDYRVGRGLVRPRVVTVTLAIDRVWHAGRGKQRREERSVSDLESLAILPDLPAAGCLTVTPRPHDATGPGEERRWLVFHGGRAGWPDLHEAVRLPHARRGRRPAVPALR